VISPELEKARMCLIPVFVQKLVVPGVDFGVPKDNPVFGGVVIVYSGSVYLVEFNG